MMQTEGPLERAALFVMDAETIITAVLSDGKLARFEAGGDSMFPVIRSGDRLLVEPARIGELHAGDVVLAKQDRGLTAHRVVGVLGETIITRGDNCDANDPPLAMAQLLGRVRSIERDGRTRSPEKTLWSRLHAAVHRWRAAIVRK
jgi:hypothetical protein